MGDLLIHDIPDAMNSDIAARAERNGTSVSDEAKVLLRKAMADVPGAAMPERSAWESMREIFAPRNAAEALEAEDYAKIMEEIEAERKKDFGRLPEDLA